MLTSNEIICIHAMKQICNSYGTELFNRKITISRNLSNVYSDKQSPINDFIFVFHVIHFYVTVDEKFVVDSN